MPFIQMTFKRGKSLAWTANHITFLFLFRSVQACWLKTNQMSQEYSLCEFWCHQVHVWLFWDGKEQGGDPPDWQVVLLNAVSEELFT